jgi:hypothetical protein
MRQAGVALWRNRAAVQTAWHCLELSAGQAHQALCTCRARFGALPVWLRLGGGLVGLQLK